MKDPTKGPTQQIAISYTANGNDKSTLLFENVENVEGEKKLYHIIGKLWLFKNTFKTWQELFKNYLNCL